MVLEHLFPEDWLERKARYAFILGVVYSVIGILFAKLLFPEDPALVSVAFTSLLLLPELYKLFSIEERQERRERLFSLRELYRDSGDFVKTYLFLFFGILLTYAVLTMLLSNFEISHLFGPQLAVRNSYSGTSGQAASGLMCDAAFDGRGQFMLGSFAGLTCNFTRILFNNIWVLLACFLLSLITGDGAIFLITWNASVWGTIFGYTARQVSSLFDVHPYGYFALIMLIVLPHMTLEALAYIMAAVSGGIISKDVLLEKFESSRFWEVFIYNAVLLLIALIILLLAALVETGVLTYSHTYWQILNYAY